MSGALTFRFTTQAQLDIRRITRELSNLQRQVASGDAAHDLLGFGGGASRLLNAQSLKANADSRTSVIQQLQARFGVQGAALGQVSDSAQMLAQSIREAIASNDGRGIATELELSFNSIVSALNETWNGQPLFAGERQGAGPIKINTLDELTAAAGPDDIFDEATRHQVLDLGVGEPIVLSAKASEISQGLLETLSDLKQLLDGAGGTIGQPISAAHNAALQNFADRLDDEATKFTNEEGRAGQLQKRFATERVRLQERSNLLLKEIGDQADADVAEVSVKLSSLLVQYEAAAKTFSELSKLSLLDYL
ncbi:MAG TPA: flagellin [Vitreimonas sp.]|uniref:flagellin n=1 Tax=Vitreimonas sp. TaxID=3069702 RepID=UPI002D69FC11|nr:flagellin [Vitreimonas sp.]HYD87756.1 flagellin [Vitreimonas sp.]